MSYRKTLAGLIVTVCAVQRAGAVTILSNPDPMNPGNNFNNLVLEPNGLSQYVGTFGTTPGVPISPYYMLTSSHADGGISNPPVTMSPSVPPVTDTFTYANGTNTSTQYQMTRVATYDDLAIWKVNTGQPTFSLYAPLYSNSSNSELGQPLVVLGQGTKRGNAEMMNGNTVGWDWGSQTGNISWGDNTVDFLYTESSPTDNGFNGQYLYYTFDRKTDGMGNLTDPNEAILTGGDSGGPLFTLDPVTGKYELAGINSQVDLVETSADSSGPLYASLFDSRGYYSGGTLISNTVPVPEGSYDIDLVSDKAFIDQVTGLPEPGTLGLAGAAGLFLLHRATRRGRRTRA